MALAEQARDLSALMGQLETDGTVRARLAALPGPVLPPSRPGEVLMVVDSPTSATTAPPSGLAWIVPVSGRLVSGFGERAEVGLTTGITLVASGGAQVVSPADGRVAFAGAYRGLWPHRDHRTFRRLDHAGHQPWPDQRNGG